MEKRASGRILFLIALALLLSLATAGLFKATVEAVLPGPEWYQKLVRYEENGGASGDLDPEQGSGPGTYDLGRASRRYLLLVAVVLFVSGLYYFGRSENTFADVV